MLDRLSDITYKQTLSDRLLRCGDILIESAGREGQEVLVDVPRPTRIQNEISRLVSQRQSGPAPAAAWAAPAPFAANPSGAGTPAPSSSGEIARGTVGSGRVYVGPAPSEVTTGSLSEPTVAEQLSQLDDLRRRGVISRREFAAKKSELLSRM